MIRKKEKIAKQASALHEDESMMAYLEETGYQSITNEAEEIQHYTQMFRESGNKVTRVNIRMTARDVEKARSLALREGIPYATLLTSILHRYLTGRLKEDKV